jgi:peptidyl-prolyl cis-trans isomerase SurA
MMNMKLNSLFLAGVVAAATCGVVSAQAPRAITLDRVVAVVNDEAITRTELESQKRAVAANMQRQGLQVPNNDTLERQVLERFINERAELQFARVSAPTMLRWITRSRNWPATTK